MNDQAWLERAFELAIGAEGRGDLPIGAVIVLDGEIISEGASAILVPSFHPGRHAEMEALKGVPEALWPRHRDMSCYTTLEPCVMCFGALLLHGFGRVVFGANDVQGGATRLLTNLPPYYDRPGVVPTWVGPINSALCDPLYQRAARRFESFDA
jgi:tRNA(adenine34) deaminase